ncbi:PREDICTED: transcription initiation factor TFIID subunit 4-like [Rhinopithecus bieti]|uniref:transcription initiation factor TFIID subunit 4-like n=1 Tax=Rhinopithecus bieti TaxID=61621 RepID=UPI00083BE5AC|nr:PREDICTED: transcription initiation factor TFIID subunit 4-like [Rhinopithecus bieti]
MSATQEAAAQWGYSQDSVQMRGRGKGTQGKVIMYGPPQKPEDCLDAVLPSAFSLWKGPHSYFRSAPTRGTRDRPPAPGWPSSEHAERRFRNRSSRQGNPEASRGRPPGRGVASPAPSPPTPRETRTAATRSPCESTAGTRGAATRRLRVAAGRQEGSSWRQPFPCLPAPPQGLREPLPETGPPGCPPVLRALSGEPGFATPHLSSPRTDWITVGSGPEEPGPARSRLAAPVSERVRSSPAPDVTAAPSAANRESPDHPGNARGAGRGEAGVTARAPPPTAQPPSAAGSAVLQSEPPGREVAPWFPNAGLPAAMVTWDSPRRPPQVPGLSSRPDVEVAGVSSGFFTTAVWVSIPGNKRKMSGYKVLAKRICCESPFVTEVTMNFQYLFIRENCPRTVEAMWCSDWEPVF